MVAAGGVKACRALGTFVSRTGGFAGTVSLESSGVGPGGELDLARVERSLAFLKTL